MSSFREHPRGGEIEGLPIGLAFTQRAQRSPQASAFLEIISEVQKQRESEENLRYLAYTDSLTGLPNNRAFAEAFQVVVDEASVPGEQVGLVLADIDGLKYVNDTYGHDKGNELIKKVAEVLRNQSRPKDRVFRLTQGDEFAIILTSYGIDIPEDDATTVSQIEQSKEERNLKIERAQNELDLKLVARYTEAVRVAVEQLGLPADIVGISLGVAQLIQSESAGDWFNRADKRLYSQKGQRYEPLKQTP